MKSKIVAKCIYKMYLIILISTSIVYMQGMTDYKSNLDIKNIIVEDYMCATNSYIINM